MMDPPEDETPDAPEADEDEKRISPSAEMEEALREAAESYKSRQSGEGGAEQDAGDDPGDPSGVSSPDKLTIEMLSNELRELKAVYEEKVRELEEQNERYLRLQADFENFRRRSLKEKQESLQFGHQNIVKDLLSAVDNLERALEHGAQNAGPEVGPILDGVELVLREILATLAKHGVSQIEAEGKTFDPALHEAMGQVPSTEVPAHDVIEVLQKGYQIRDRMLRPARVIVSSGPPGESGGLGGAGA